MTSDASSHYIICRHFTFGELLRFAFPSILMMLAVSLYSVVDGFFVAHFIGTTALSALNITTPVMGFLIAVGLMFATGGGAHVGSLIGKGDTVAANRDFSLIVLTSIGISCVLAAFCLFNLI